MSTIALITDFGTIDGFVGAMKGVMVSIAPHANIIDISHECAPHNTYHAAFVLWSNYRYFPKDTVFVVVVDPGVGSERRIVLIESEDGRKILAPENGVLGFILPEIKNPKSYHVNKPEYWLTPTSNTFHGRDIFAPIAAHIVKGKQGEDLGIPVKLSVPTTSFLDIDDYTTELEGKIIHSDRFGNLITNIRPRSNRIDDIQLFSLEIGDRTIGSIRKTYSSGDYGELIAIIGSSGLIEVAVRNSSAHQMLGLRVGDPVLIRSNPGS